MSRRSMVRITGLPLSAMMCGMLLLSGCAGDGGIASSQTSATDVCRPQRLALDDSRQFFAGDMVKGALIGAVGGGLTGLLSGGQNRGQAALIVAGAGAAAGALAGYWVSQQNQGGTHSDLISRMVGDMSRDQEQLDKAQAAFNSLVDCRKASAAMVNADLKAGRIDRATAELRMADVRQLAQQDIQIAREINTRLDERTGNYAYATEQATGVPIQTAEVEAPPAPGSAPAKSPTVKKPRPAPRPTAKAANPEDDKADQVALTLVAKKQAFATSTQQAQADANGFQLS